MDSEPPSTISVTLEASAWRDAVDNPFDLCRRAVVATLARAAPGSWLTGTEVGILLTDDASLRELNVTFRGQDRPTNVLSFPILDLSAGARPPRPAAPSALLGDIALAFETVCGEAKAAGKPLAVHLGHLVVHGCLHLLGHDHQDDAGATAMEDLERLILADLGIPDPYPDDASPMPAPSAPAMEALR